jgi:hypothetical protein
VSKLKISTQYDHHKIPGLKCTEPSKTQAQFADDADINQILTRYRNLDLEPSPDRPPPIFGDFSDERITDYHKAMQTITGIDELMHQLDARVRKRFNNNPAEILAFVADVNNRAEAEELGLIDKPPVEPRTIHVEPDKK